MRTGPGSRSRAPLPTSSRTGRATTAVRRLPGARGNVALAAHRAGHGDPFLDFDTLRIGDEILVEQRRVRWTYRLVTAPRIVGVDASWVLRPSTTRELTLTTCWPRYGSSKRMYVRARLTDVDQQRGPDWESVWSATG